MGLLIASGEEPQQELWSQRITAADTKIESDMGCHGLKSQAAVGNGHELPATTVGWLASAWRSIDCVSLFSRHAAIPPPAASPSRDGKQLTIWCCNVI